MEIDRLSVFNLELVAPLTSMSDEQLWNFLMLNEPRIKEIIETRKQVASGFLYANPYGIERIRELFLDEIEYYREGVIFTMILDFCFVGEKVNLDYWARCAFLDDADSCGALTSDEIMPPIDEDSEQFYYSKYFHLLELAQVENIIAAMEKNFDKLEMNTREDIDKIKQMKNLCLENEGYRVVYIYDI